MKLEKFVDNFMTSDFVKSELPIQMQLGIPYLFKRNNQLCIAFFPHREEYADNAINFYEKQYSLEVLYPSCKVLKFVDLIYDNQLQTVKKTKTIETVHFINNGKQIINKLYDLGSKILNFYDRYGKVSDIQTEEYQMLFSDTVEKLGLSELYEVSV